METIVLNSLAYIDPGVGQQIAAQFGPLAGILVMLLAAVLWPFKQGVLLFLRGFKKYPKGTLLFLFLLITAAVYAGRTYFIHATWQPGAVSRVMLIGMDGLDSEIMERMMEKGELPHFKALKEKGSYARLETTLPAQSPCAWSTVSTGLNPGGHGLYDFLRRHKHNYMPDLALSELKPTKLFNLFGLKIPYGKPHYENLRKGTPVWAHTSTAGVPTRVLHFPVTFPPEKVNGVMLSGMGVPDLRGTQGTFSFYTDAEVSNNVQGGLRIQVEKDHDKIETVFKGPWRKDKTELSLPLQFHFSQDKIKIVLQNHESELTLKNWSPWIRARFSNGTEGMTRFYLKSLSPHFEVYASALHFTPENPAHPISYPKRYAKELQEAVGDFHTLGMPHDTWALNEEAMDEEMFLEQTSAILTEETKMLKYELQHFKEGFFSFVFVTPDRIQHMFWRAVDTESPLYSDALAKKYGDVIPNAYRQMDDLLGLILTYVDERTALMVVSDHGFKSFRRSVNLNSWLKENGYLVYQRGYRNKEGAPFYEGVDWKKTKAYAVGLGGIYLNLKGRERDGIISGPAEADKLRHEIAEKLEALRDAEHNQSVISKVYRKEEIFEGAFTEDAPDLVIGFWDGYRASWQTALGAAPDALIEDNLKKWSGDHILDPKLVPGIFFSNQKINAANPSLYDLSPTILSLLGIEVPSEQKGNSLL